MKKTKEKKSRDYLQFLKKIELDQTSNSWYFTYLEPVTEKVIRISNKIKSKVVKKRVEIEQRLITFQKAKKPKIKSDSTVIEKNFKKRPFKKVIKEKNRLITTEFLNKALELKLEGYGYDEIKIELIKKYHVSESSASSAVDWAYKELSSEVDDDFIKLTILSHSEAYDDLFKKFRDLNSHKLAMKPLRQKEILNGYGSEIFEIQVNNFSDEPEELVTYGLGKLTENEQQELVDILSKIKNLNDQSSTKQIQAPNSH